MELAGRVVVVTGGGSGIGAALCRRCAAEGAAAILVADVDAAAADRVAAEVGGAGVLADVSVEADVQALVQRSLDEHGRIDVYCSNAGVGIGGGADAPDEDWQRSWDVNVMAHVFAARAILPGMLERGEGYLVGTISAAALLNHIVAAPYAATKAAALSFLEWLSIAHGDAGLRVSAVCPQGVRTPMLLRDADTQAFLLESAIEPEQVADAVVEGMREERFLILPHPEVAELWARKADYDRWLRGMRRLRARALHAAE
ncbi:MAG: SDR family oxidoreductase [Candidatus Dormibacteraeota bacterium]|nr:SDR family oxidoreductase [Candidatus Dormibacteraeota bacterium]